MCRVFKIIYACGHKDLIKAPCEWRDEGRFNILGKHVPCENSTRNLADLSRLCMACSPDPAGQDLVNLSSSQYRHDVDSYIVCDEKYVVATIVRNESHLRRRAKISPVIPTPSILLGFPTSSELQYQFCVNEEFLARRLKRRYFQQHLERQCDYQDFLEAAQAHLDARDALNCSIFSVQSSSQATTTSTVKGQGAFPQGVRTPTVNSSMQTDDIGEVVVRPLSPSPPFWSESEESLRSSAWCPRTREGPYSAVSPESDDSSMTIRPSNSRASSPFPATASPESDNSREWATDPRPQDLNDYQWVHQAHERLQSIIAEDEREVLTSSGELGESFSFIELTGGETQQPEQLDQDQFAEWSGFVRKLSDEWAEQGKSSPEAPELKVPLESPEGIARLADIRFFLGMRPDTKPLDIWNFAPRNNDLMANIMDSTLPVRHRHLGQARRPGFDRDPRLDTVSDYADNKWELRKGFVDVWNSLSWAFESLSDPSPEISPPATDEIDGGDHISNIDELNLSLSIDAQYEIEQGDEQEQENKEEQEEKFQLEGRRARVPFEVDFGGKLKAAKHQAINASPLRMSWTYADPRNPASLRESQDGVGLPLSSPPASHTFQDDKVSRLSSPPASLTSQEVPVSPLFSSQSTLLISDHDAIPPLSLDDSDLNFEEPKLAPGSSDSSSSGSTSPRVFECMCPPSLIQSDSARGQRMLADLRKILAMPDSKTPQDISLFIDLHPGLMKALRTGHVPLKEPRRPKSRREARQQKAEASFDPLQHLRAHSDREQRLMRKNLALCLKMLDWDEIDSAPIPFTPSSPWAGYDPGAKRDRPDDDDEEECNHWARTMVSPEPNGVSTMDMKYLIKHQVKKPSPLRTMLMRREPGGEATPTEVAPEERFAFLQNDPEEGAPSSFEPEVWDDVDLSGSCSLPESDA